MMKIGNRLSNQNKVLLALLLLAFAIYCIVIYRLFYGQDLTTIFYSTGDSKEYRGCAIWIAGETGYYNEVRTYFYPLLLFISTKIAGITGAYILNVLFWIGALILVFKSTILLTKNIWLASIVFLIVASNISLMVLTVHGLTEITVFFLLALLVYFLIKTIQSPQNTKNVLTLLFIFSCLAVTKPLYQWVWYIALLIILVKYFKPFLNKKTIFLYLFLAISPVILQKAISVIKLNTFNTTSIANSNLKKYFYRKLIYINNDGTFEAFDMERDNVHEAQKVLSDKVSEATIINFILHNPVNSIKVFYDNLKDNLAVGSSYINRNTNRTLWKLTENINNKVFYLHLYFPIIFIVFLIRKFKRRHEPFYRFILISGLLTIYILYSSGLVFWAGDRLVVPAISLWSVLYVYGINLLVKKPIVIS